jgi:hypothetical protein
MAVFDGDSDDEGDTRIEELEANYGRFNAERAACLAQRRSDVNGNPREDLIVVDGDDRHSFLCHCPYNLLMWWHILDKYNCMYFLMACLDTASSVSCGRTPSNVSRKKQKTDYVDKEKQFDLQSEMVDNVTKMGKSIETVTRASLTHQIEGLQQKKFDLEMEKLRSGGNAEMSTLIDRRVKELDSNITSLQAQLHQSHSNNDVSHCAIEFNTPRSN